jgi:cephalosporin-C deacetylase-like acetyl esterase
MRALILLAVPLVAQESLQVSTSDLRGMAEAHLTRLAEKHWKERAARVAAIKTADEVAARQRYIRSTIIESLGGFPSEKTPLNAQVTGTIERSGYRIEKLIYESLPGFKVTANLFVPATGKPPYPAVLGVAGHSDTGKAQALYQTAWTAMALRGYVVLAYDPPGQGERSEYWDPVTQRSRIGIGTREHTMAGVQCLLTGTSIARYELWDGIRGVDYLLTRRDVDPKRIAVAGNSGGGTQSAYLAVVEPRLAAAAPSCYITAWERLWFAPGPQDAEQNFHGFLRDGLDFGDFLIAFAPKPLKVMTAIRDYFPIDGARATFAEAARIYGVVDARDKIDFFEYDDPHGWSKPRREATYRFLQKHLNGVDDEGVEPEIVVEPAASLNATATGQLATSGGGETVASLNRKLAEELYPKRAAAGVGDAARLRALVAARLGVTRLSGPITAEKTGEVGREGYRIEKLLLETEPGILLPALLAIPAAAARPLAALLYVHQGGKAADARPRGDIEALVRAGHAVLAVDVRGYGETGPRPGAGGYSSLYQLFMRGYLLGKPLAGMQVADLLRAFDYLAGRAGIDRSRIAILGKGNGGLLALHAAALEPRIAKVAAEGSVLSYMSIARAPQHEGVLEVVVPGVLKDYDLPDLARAITPRKLLLVAPRTPMGSPLDPAEAAKEFPVTVVPRPDGWSFEKVYADWLAW